VLRFDTDVKPREASSRVLAGFGHRGRTAKPKKEQAPRFSLHVGRQLCSRKAAEGGISTRSICRVGERIELTDRRSRSNTIALHTEEGSKNIFRSFSPLDFWASTVLCPSTVFTGPKRQVLMPVWHTHFNMVISVCDMSMHRQAIRQNPLSPFKDCSHNFLPASVLCCNHSSTFSFQKLQSWWQCPFCTRRGEGEESRLEPRCPAFHASARAASPPAPALPSSRALYRDRSRASRVSRAFSAASGAPSRHLLTLKPVRPRFLASKPLTFTHGGCT